MALYICWKRLEGEQIVYYNDRPRVTFGEEIVYYTDRLIITLGKMGSDLVVAPIYTHTRLAFLFCTAISVEPQSL